MGYRPWVVHPEVEAVVGTQRIKSLPPSGEAWEDFTEELIVSSVWRRL